MPYISRHPFTKLKYFFIAVIIVNKLALKLHDGEKSYKNSKHSAYLSKRAHRSYSSFFFSGFGNRKNWQVSDSEWWLHSGAKQCMFVTFVAFHSGIDHLLTHKFLPKIARTASNVCIEHNNGVHKPLFFFILWNRRSSMSRLFSEQHDTTINNGVRLQPGFV